MKILIIVPAFNCGQTLSSILKELPSYSTIIIDDGSIDDTSAIAKSEGFDCIRYLKNIGVGAALKTGINYGLENDFDFAITIDADGQHPIDKISDFGKLLMHFDFVIGNRFRNISLVPDCKLSSNCLASLIIQMIFGNKLLDVACGFRAFKLSYDLNYIKENGYGFLHNHLMKVLDEKKRLGIVDIDCIYDYGQPICTRRSEVQGFLEAALIFVTGNESLFKIFSKLLIESNKDADLRFTLQSVEFYGIFIAELDSYIFQINKKSIYEFYNK